MDFLHFSYLCAFLYLHQVRLRQQLLTFTVSLVLFILFELKCAEITLNASPLLRNYSAQDIVLCAH